MDTPNLRELLSDQETELRRILRRHGGGLLRFESVSDLVQGVYVSALGTGNFDYRGPAAFRGWLEKIARGYIGRRYEYWKARKRDAGLLLRVTSNDFSQGDTPGVNPAASVTSPSSFALRRERFVLAAKAIDMLPERDREILRAMAEGSSIEEISKQLEVSYDAAERARLRALDRFQKTFKLLLS